MSSIDRSVQNFIAHPENHHLINEGGVIKALPGRLPTHEAVHKIALDALNALPTEEGTNSSGLASFFTSAISLFSSSNSSLIKGCQQAEFTYKIDKWAQEPSRELGENRIEAAKRIKKAYTLKERILELNNLRLTSLPPAIGQLAELQELDLSHNQLTTLPPEIAQLAQLKWLNLYINYLSALPPEIGQLAQLQGLDLSDNHFNTLPPAIAQLAQLQKLWLRTNQFTTLPPEIGQLAQLQGLDLSHNQLITLPPEIAQLVNRLERLWIHNNPLTDNKPPIQILASYPFLLKLIRFYINDDSVALNRQATLNNPQILQEICELNGLALEFIPHDKQTEDLVLTAITQNPASIAFARPDLMTYEFVKRAVAINPNTARFVPDHVIDIPTVVREIEKEPYLLTLFLKKAPLETLQEELTKNNIKPTAEGAPDTIIKAEDVIQAAIGYDGRIISFIPADIQASDFGHDLIIQALEQTPLAYYGIDPVFFNQYLLTLMIQRHKDHPDLKPILKHILSLMDTQDTALHDKMLNFAYPLSQYFHDDKDIILMLISKYGISLQDISDDLKADYDIVFAAIHHDPGEITYSQVTDPSEKRILQQYARERRRQLNR